MPSSRLRNLMRKYWYIIVIALVVAGCAGYALHRYAPDMEPRALLSEWGYLAILIWTFFEGETIVIISGLLSTSLGLKPWLIALSAFCGSFCSDQIMFSLGKYKGDAVLGYFPKIGSKLDKAAGLFKRYDTILILGFRFVYGVRNITPIMLGISGVGHKKFLFLNFIGAAVWALSFTYGGLYIGKAFMKAMGAMGHGAFYALLGIGMSAGALWYFRARRNVKQAEKIARRCAEEQRAGLEQSEECKNR